METPFRVAFSKRTFGPEDVIRAEQTTDTRACIGRVTVAVACSFPPVIRIHGS